MKKVKWEFLEFVDKVVVLIVVMFLVKGVVFDKYLYFFGNFGQIGIKLVYEVMEECDLLIMFGILFLYCDYLFDDMLVIQFDLDLVKIGKCYLVIVGFVCDLVFGLCELMEFIEWKEDRRFLEVCIEYMQYWWNEIEKDEIEVEILFRFQQVVVCFQEVVVDNVVFFVDVGIVIVWMVCYFKMNENQDFIVFSWFVIMGCGLLGVIVLSLVELECQVIVVCGDGGFFMVMQDFLIVVKYKFLIIVVILNNENFGMIEYEQQVKGNIDYVMKL